MITETSFKQKWFNFFKAVFAPVPIISFLGATVLIIISILYKDKSEFSILINLIGSLLLGVMGAFIKGGYDDLSRESVLIKKGQSAIRNLASINLQVIQIRSWIEYFIKKNTVSKRELEEINRHLETTNININSGLSDWTDIIPELKSTEDVVKSYESVIKAYVEELLKNKKELIEVGENKELKDQLEKRIKELESNVKSLRLQQSNVFNSGISVSPSVSPSASYVGSMISNPINISQLLKKTCSVCGKVYQENDWNANSLLSISSNDICSECKNKPKN